MANLNRESCHSLIGFPTPEYIGFGFLKLQVIHQFMGTGTCISPVPVNRNRGILTSLITQIDEEILNLCDVREIGVEIEESAEISDRISETKRKIDKQTKAAKNHDNINTNVNDMNSNLNSATEQGNTTNLIESSTSTTNTTGGNEIEENTSHNSVNSQASPQQTITTNMTTTPGNFMSSLPKLPKLELPEFGGQITEWNSYWDLYDSAIHSNPSISKVNKFNYLQSLLEGNAAQAIKGLTLTGANYDAAVKILQERFGKTQQSISAHMDEI